MKYFSYIYIVNERYDKKENSLHRHGWGVS